MSTDEKIQRYRQTQDDSIFTAADWKRLSGRFNTARNVTDGAGAQAARQAWSAVCSLGRGQGQERKKRAIVKAWMLDQEFSNNFVDLISQLAYQEGLSQEAEWLTTKEFFDKYGDSEAEEMIANDRVQARHNP